MPLPNPPFPRRGIPSKLAPRLPARRGDARRPFFRTREGYRFLFYGFLLLAFAGTMLGKLGQWKARQNADSRPAAESRAIPLTSPPRAFASSDVRHSLLTLDDFTPAPRDSAITAALKFLGGREGPESRPAALDYTELDIDESVAHPEAFRGGLVKTRGVLLGISTKGPEDALTYRGWLIVRVGREDRIIVWETDVAPEFEKGDMLDVRGVFLQAVTYADAKARLRTVPFIAAEPLTRTAAAEQPHSFRDKLFTLGIILLIILILATTLFLFKKSRRSAPANRYVARPPGPGR